MYKLKKSVICALALSVSMSGFNNIASFAESFQAIQYYNSSGDGEHTDISLFNANITKSGKLRLTFSGEKVDDSKLSYFIYKDNLDVTSKYAEHTPPIAYNPSFFISNPFKTDSDNNDGSYFVIAKYDNRVVKKGGNIWSYRFSVKSGSPTKPEEVTDMTELPSEPQLDSKGNNSESNQPSTGDIHNDSSTTITPSDTSLSENSSRSEASKLDYSIESLKIVTSVALNSSPNKRIIQLKGKSLPENLYIKVFKGDEDITSNISKNFDTGKIKLNGFDFMKSASVDFPDSNQTEEYNIKLYNGNHLEREESTVIYPISTAKKSVEFPVNSVYQSDENQITIEANENIKADSLKELKASIKIQLQSSSPISLTEEDEVKIISNKIVITLPEYSGEQLRDALGSNSRVTILPNTLKNSIDNPLKKLDYLIVKMSPSIKNVDITEGSVLTSSGGKVSLKIHGRYLSDDKNTGTKINVIENSRYSQPIKITPTIEGEGNVQTIKFDLPPNTTSVTKTYTIRLSTNGINYSSNIVNDAKLDPDNSIGRANKLVVSLLPSNSTINTQTLSFMSISSYNTSGGGSEQPDNTVTTSPISQSSRKTFVTIYGTNLKAGLTKLRVIDQNGVAWYPSLEVARGYFGTVLSSETGGVFGNGNVQTIEVIAPNKYKDTSYKYEVAIDGVNYNNSIYVTANVPAIDGNSKPSITEFKREATIKFEDMQENEIAPNKKMILAGDMPLDMSDALPKIIDGYHLVAIKGVNSENIKKYEAISKKKIKTLDDLDNLREYLNITVDNANFDKSKEAISNNKVTIVYLYEKDKVVPVNSLHSRSHYNKIYNTEKKELEESTKKEINDKIKFFRVSGKDRVETSIFVSKNYYKKSDTVILADADKYSDVLSATSYAGAIKAPILLVKNSEISKNTISEINRLEPKKIILVGGQTSISDKVLLYFRNKNIIRIAGKNRFETSLKLSQLAIKNGQNKSFILVNAKNSPDGLLASSLVNKYKAAIILLDNTSDSKQNIEFVNRENKENIILGGFNSISKSVESKIKNSRRIAGKDRYETSMKVAKYILKYNDKIFVASGNNFVDSLSIGALVAREDKALILVNLANSNLSHIKNKYHLSAITVIGGNKSISQETFAMLKK